MSRDANGVFIPEPGALRADLPENAQRRVHTLKGQTNTPEKAAWQDDTYMPGGNPSLRYSFVLFADVLGFKSKVKEAGDSNRQQDCLTEYYETLVEARELIAKRNNKLLNGGRIHSFTDNVLIGIPVFPLHESKRASNAKKLLELKLGLASASEDNHPIQLGLLIPDLHSKLADMCRIASLFQVAMTRHGFFVRGGLTLGDLHMSGHDEGTDGDRSAGDLSFGYSTVEAYCKDQCLKRSQVCDSRRLHR